MKIYAIVRSGGKQYRVEPDQLIDVDSLPAEVGSTVEMTDVLLVAVNGGVKVGRPVLEGARVIAEVVEQGRGPKMIVFKYKPKTRYRRRRGHRQGYTRLVVRQILTAKESPEAEEKPKRRRSSKAEAEPKPVRRTRARKPKAEAAPVKAEEKPARRTRARKPKAEAAPVEAEKKPARRTRASRPKAEAEATPVEAQEAEAKPAPRTRAHRPTAKSETKKPKRTRTKTESD